MKLSALIMSLALVGFVAQADDHAAPAAAPAAEVTAPAVDAAPAADMGGKQHKMKEHGKKKHGKKGKKEKSGDDK
ncbi:MAG: hypothetical protein AABY64_04855 [Bdellovibrionota bacterium]